jgi:hypothetical protein
MQDTFDLIHISFPSKGSQLGGLLCMALSPITTEVAGNSVSNNSNVNNE